MTTKEFLGQWVKLKKYAEKCFEEYDEIMIIGPKSPQLDGMPRGSGSSDVSATVAKIDAIRKKAEDARMKALEALDEIQDAIETVPDAEERAVLRLRYIYGLKWEAVAKEMCVSEAHIYRIHGKALMHVKR